MQMQRGLWQRENKSGLVFDTAWKWLLLPGLVIQWFLYMFPSGGFGKVVSDTRVARSLLMTYLISAAFYVAAAFALSVFLLAR